MFKKIYLAFTRGERIVFLSTVLLAAISGAILAGLGFIASTRAVPAQGGEYTQGFVGQPVYINPVIASTEIDKSIVRLIFSDLQSLADKIEASDDGRTWKVRLRENLHWQDGEKLTSDDVIFTIQKIQDQESRSPLFLWWVGVAAQRQSELELQLSRVNPSPFFGDTAKNLYILPKHIFADVPPANWRISDYNLKPVGSGPYQFTPYEKQLSGFISAYHLIPWDKYFGDKPLIKNFNFQFFSQKEDLIKSFNSGQVYGISGLEPDDLAQIKRPYGISSFELPRYYAVFLNQNKSVPLKDQAVRAALNLTVDRDTLVSSVFGGRAEPDFGPIPKYSSYFNPDAASTTVSLELASSTLDRAGWKIGPDGVRAKTIGTTKITLELDFTLPQIDYLVATANILKDAWQKIGFKINLIQAPLEEVAGDTVKNRDYQMLLAWNTLDTSYDLYAFWHSSQRFYPGLNLSLYNSKKADQLIEAIEQNTDDAKRKTQFFDLQSTIAGDSPAIFLYSPYYLYASDKNLHGLESGQIAEPADIFASVSKWYMKTARVLK